MDVESVDEVLNKNNSRISANENDKFTQQRWIQLHSDKRFLPQFPSEEVIRFVFSNFPNSLEKRKKISFIDIGCGGGRHTLFLGREGFLVTAVDFSLTGVEYTRQLLLKENLPAKVMQDDFKKLSFSDQSFDGAIAYASIYYTDWQGLQSGINEIYRVLKPGGKTLIVTRTIDDCRFQQSNFISERSAYVSRDDTNEKGMIMTFLDRSDIDLLCKDFSFLSIDRHDFTLNNGKMINSDWIIVATK